MVIGQQHVTFFSCEMKFLMWLARGCCWPKQCPLLCSNLQSVIGLWVRIWHRNKTACSKLNPVPLNRQSIWGKGVCSSTEISDGSTQKLGNDVRRNSESIATKACSQISSKWNVMFASQRWQDKLWFSIWRIFEQSALVNIHLLYYWSTIHNFISKTCPNFQVISSHFFWAKIVQRENISTPICRMQ